MSVQEAFNIAAAILGAVGGGGLIVAGSSSWLGKVWADRLMLRERVRHEADLEKFRAELYGRTNAELETIKRELDLVSAHRLRELNDKILIYRGALDLVAEVLGEFDRASLEGPRPDQSTFFHDFNTRRLRAYTYMAMFAPQAVVDAQDALMDYLLLIANGRAPYTWPKVRELGIALVNEIRKDIGIDKNPISYKGEL